MKTLKYSCAFCEIEYILIFDEMKYQEPEYCVGCGFDDDLNIIELDKIAPKMIDDGEYKFPPIDSK